MTEDQFRRLMLMLEAIRIAIISTVNEDNKLLEKSHAHADHALTYPDEDGTLIERIK